MFLDFGLAKLAAAQLSQFCVGRSIGLLVWLLTILGIFVVKVHEHLLISSCTLPTVGGRTKKNSRTLTTLIPNLLLTYYLSGTLASPRFRIADLPYNRPQFTPKRHFRALQ